jgi:hypothetical protein
MLWCSRSPTKGQLIEQVTNLCNNPHDGRQTPDPSTCASTYYLRLKQMVADKMVGLNGEVCHSRTSLVSPHRVVVPEVGRIGL